MSELFSGSGSDPAFLAIRDDGSYSKERAECERLWSLFKTLRGKDFIHDFSRCFQDRFWEMWLGAKLKELFGKVVRQPSGPDFKVECDPVAYVEATVIGRGEGKDAVPDVSTRHDDDDSVPFRECALRLMGKLREKKNRNNAKQIGENHPYVLAVNLPFPEAWLCSTPPLAAQAFLGAGGLYAVRQDDGSWQSAIGWNPTLEKQSKGNVETTTFLDDTYRRVSAIIVASVNPLSSSYANPELEVLHNPKANHPLPRGWFGFGHEYWIEGGVLQCQQYLNV